MNHIKVDILVNCCANKKLYDCILPIIQQSTGHVMSQIILCYQLYDYYGQQYDNTHKQTELFVDEDICKFLMWKEEISMKNNEKEKEGYIQRRLKTQIKAMLGNVIEVDASLPLHMAFINIPENKLMHPNLISILISKIQKIIGPDKEDYFVRMAEYNNNQFLRQVIYCQQPLFKMVNFQCINEFEINPSVYKEQADHIEKCKQSQNIEFEYSLLHRCRQCGLRKCTFQPLQTSKSDEETKARISCQNTACRFSWIQ